MILRMDEFDTDYSFLNLPEAGSAVRGPIELPSIEPIDFDLFGGPPPADDTGEGDTGEGDGGEGDGGAEGSGIFQRQPIRERGNDQARFEMGRAIGQEVNTLRQNIQTLEAAKGELVSERDAAIQMQDQIRQEMSEQRIQELDQQQAQLQAELQEAVAAAEARGIDALAEAEAQAAEELASVSADFQSQIDALTGERDQAIADQDMIRAEAADQQAQALEAQKQNYESQLAEMTGQTTQRDQTIAELQAQIEGLQQAPAETPAVPDFVKAPQMPPKRKDQIFISDQPRFISEERPLLEPIRKPVDPGRRFNRPEDIRVPRDTNTIPKNPADLIPVIRPGTGFIGGPVTVADTPFTGAGMAGAGVRPDLPPPNESALFGKRPTIRRPATPIPPAPAITPPRRPMSVGGIGGMGGRMNRMMMR